MTTQTKSVTHPLARHRELGNERIILKDGTTALLREAVESDFERIKLLLDQVSDQSRYRRFFSASSSSEDLAEQLLKLGTADEEQTLLVLHGDPEDLEVVGIGNYIRLEDKEDTAEPAFLVRDDFQGRGIGTLLLEQLAVQAATNGIKKFEAHTLPENRKMKDVFEASGFSVQSHMENGTITIQFPVTPSTELIEKSQIRDRVSTVASLNQFFEPSSIAVIGASRDTNSIGYRILKSLIDGNFAGPVYAINPNADSVQSRTAYDSVLDIENRIDCAVIVVPNDCVQDVIDECHSKDISAVVVVTAGFSETGKSGAEREHNLVDRLYGYGMRMIGPNCLGLVNTDPNIRLNASFSTIFPDSGSVAMASQSGALGLSILEYADTHGLGFSSFVSIGNKADVSGNDLIQYWESDNRTDVILLYLESFGNPRRFARLSKRIGLKKPIVVVRGGRSESGRKAASSHTAAVASPQIATEALYRQSGIIGVDSLADMFHTASFLSSQSLPAGPNVAIVTNSGGPGILCSDACETAGLSVPELQDTTVKKLQTHLPDTASVNNPIDMTASADAENYRKTLEIVHTDPTVDAIIVIHTPLKLCTDDEIARSIEEGIRTGRQKTDREIPISGVIIQPEGSNTTLMIGDENVPVYRFPENAAHVIGRTYEHNCWRNKIQSQKPTYRDFPDVDEDHARSICKSAIERGDDWMGVRDVNNLLDAVGINHAKPSLVQSADEAVQTARDIGYPVVLKMSSRTLLHKTECNGIELNLKNDGDVRNAFVAIESRIEKAGKLNELDGMTVQEHVDDGLELMVGMTEDELFGPLITFGLGGIYVEILEDISVRITPLTTLDAEEMINEIKGHKLLDGYRGRPAVDKESLTDLLLRLSQLVETVPEITELDFNPLKAFEPENGYQILDARIRVEN